MVIGLIYMIFKTISSLSNKEFMKRHNKDGMVGGYLVLALILEIVGLIFILQSFLK